MALTCEKTLYNGDVVRYHRFAEFSLDSALGLASATLHSFRNLEHRAIPVLPLNAQVFSFAWSGNSATLAEEAYNYVKTLPEWADATDA